MSKVIADAKSEAAPLALLYCADHSAVASLAHGFARERIRLCSAEQLDRTLPEIPSVLLLDDNMLGQLQDPVRTMAHLPEHVVILAGSEEIAATYGAQRVMMALPASGSPGAQLRVIRFAYQLAAARLSAARMERDLARSRTELNELHRIGIALMTERDPDTLLVRILEQARRLTQSDAGSLYLVERDEQAAKRLQFKLSQNDTLPDLPLTNFTLPIDTSSLAGYAAQTGESLVLDDAYAIPPNQPYSFNRTFDEHSGYRTKSMLLVPMLDHRSEVVGVLQLLNRKSDVTARIQSEHSAKLYVIPYGAHELKLVQSLAGQAAVSIENSQLYVQIEHLFESFVKAAVTAIDQRDPTTAGHSVRVATLTCDLAQAVERFGRGPYAGLNFSRTQLKELRYAALLHDFGKVGVREEVLVKSKKLPVHLWERVEARFDLIARSLESEYHKKRADMILANGKTAEALAALESEFRADLLELERFRLAVRGANEPTILPEAALGILDEIAHRTFVNVQGEAMPYLDLDELHFLKIPRGTLDEMERIEIESHVEQTYRFLTQIPWTSDLRQLANIAYAHHEKLTGGGYPRGISGDQIPVQTRMMTIADIFDALTASDRPYKRALSIEKALSIIQAEAKQGHIDQHLVDVLVEAEVYKKVLEKDWREL